MKTNGQFRPLIAAVAMVSTGALAQSTATPPSPPTPKMMGDAAMTRADSEYRAAQTACSAQPVAMRDQCLRDAKTKYDRAREMNGKNSKDGGNDSSGAGAGQTGGDNAGHGGTGGTGSGDSAGGAGNSSGSSGTGGAGGAGGPK